MQFSNARKTLEAFSGIKLCMDGTQTELATRCKYLGIIDESLTFKPRYENLVKTLKLSFYFRNKSCFFSAAKRKFVAPTFLALLDYDDLLHVHASAQWQVRQCISALGAVTGFHPEQHIITQSFTSVHLRDDLISPAALVWICWSQLSFLISSIFKGQFHSETRVKNTS